MKLAEILNKLASVVCKLVVAGVGVMVILSIIIELGL